jgi:integrase/recombinase XerD
VADFHSLRGLYITTLIMSGVDPKTAQELARHSTPTLTIGRYTRTNAKIKRDAVGEGE